MSVPFATGVGTDSVVVGSVAVLVAASVVVSAVESARPVVSGEADGDEPLEQPGMAVRARNKDAALHNDLLWIRVSSKPSARS